MTTGDGTRAEHPSLGAACRHYLSLGLVIVAKRIRRGRSVQLAAHVPIWPQEPKAVVFYWGAPCGTAAVVAEVVVDLPCSGKIAPS